MSGARDICLALWMETQMAEWPSEELNRIATTDDFHIAPFREDGVTSGTPTWIWSVVVEDGLYVRAYNGRDSRWYQAAMRERAGQIRAAGMTKEVSFDAVDGAINDRIDAAYRAKYGSGKYVAAAVGPRCRAATVRVSPRPA